MTNKERNTEGNTDVDHNDSSDQSNLSFLTSSLLFVNVNIVNITYLFLIVGVYLPFTK